MPNILTVVPENARGVRKLLVRIARRQYGGVVPGMLQILSVDTVVNLGVSAVYSRLHMRKSSPLSRVQREMLATVVNGKVGGAP